MLGPVSMTSLSSPVLSRASFGTNNPPRTRSTTGCLESFSTMLSPSSTTGLEYPYETAASAKERSTSNEDTADAMSRTFSPCLATSPLTRPNMSYSSVCMRSCAASIDSSRSFSSGVTYRSPVLSVCLRM